jgi:prolyl 4-hydroxylase
MNYGHGGLISAHKYTFSSAVNETNCSEHFSYGGQRIVTFKTYLTNLELGGNTIFPNIGLSVKPAKGTALLWFNFNR